MAELIWCLTGQLSMAFVLGGKGSPSEQVSSFGSISKQPILEATRQEGHHPIAEKKHRDPCIDQYTENPWPRAQQSGHMGAHQQGNARNTNPNQDGLLVALWRRVRGLSGQLEPGFQAGEHLDGSGSRINGFMRSAQPFRISDCIHVSRCVHVSYWSTIT